MKSYNADAMPLSSNLALLPPYLLQLMGMSRKQLEQSRLAASSASVMEVDPAPPKVASNGLKLNIAARPFVPPTPASAPPIAATKPVEEDEGGYGYPSTTSRTAGGRSGSSSFKGGRGYGRSGSGLPPLSPRDPSMVPAPPAAINEVPLPTVLAALTADLGPMAERLLRQEFEDLFDSVVSSRRHSCYMRPLGEALGTHHE